MLLQAGAAIDLVDNSGSGEGGRGKGRGEWRLKDSNRFSRSGANALLIVLIDVFLEFLLFEGAAIQLRSQF